MSPPPLVSVVMTVLDPHPVYFPEAVESVLRQTCANLELVIVEDPSAQSAGELLKRFNDSRIVHHCNSHRTSHSRQRNQSLSLARAELVATMDADDICDHRRIAKQVEFLQAHPEISVVGSHLAIVNREGRPSGWRNYPVSHDEILAAFPRFNPLAHPSVMFRKSVVLAAGGYQYDRFPAVEDYELWSRLAERGVRFANLPEALLKYRLHPGAMKATRLRGIIRGTLAIKQRFWRKRLGWRGHLRAWMERLLLAAPPQLTYRLFTASQIRRRPGSGILGASNRK